MDGLLKSEHFQPPHTLFVYSETFLLKMMHRFWPKKEAKAVHCVWWIFLKLLFYNTDTLADIVTDCIFFCKSKTRTVMNPRFAKAFYPQTLCIYGIL